MVGGVKRLTLMPPSLWHNDTDAAGRRLQEHGPVSHNITGYLAFGSYLAAVCKTWMYFTLFTSY